MILVPLIAGEQNVFPALDSGVMGASRPGSDLGLVFPVQIVPVIASLYGFGDVACALV